MEKKLLSVETSKYPLISFYSDFLNRKIEAVDLSEVVKTIDENPETYSAVVIDPKTFFYLNVSPIKIRHELSSVRNRGLPVILYTSQSSLKASYGMIMKKHYDEFVYSLSTKSPLIELKSTIDSLVD